MSHWAKVNCGKVRTMTVNRHSSSLSPTSWVSLFWFKTKFMISLLFTYCSNLASKSLKKVSLFYFKHRSLMKT